MEAGTENDFQRGLPPPRGLHIGRPLPAATSYTDLKQLFITACALTGTDICFILKSNCSSPITTETTNCSGVVPMNSRKPRPQLTA